MEKEKWVCAVVEPLIGQWVVLCVVSYYFGFNYGYCANKAPQIMSFEEKASISWHDKVNGSNDNEIKNYQIVIEKFFTKQHDGAKCMLKEIQLQQQINVEYQKWIDNRNYAEQKLLLTRNMKKIYEEIVANNHCVVNFC